MYVVEKCFKPGLVVSKPRSVCDRIVVVSDAEAIIELKRYLLAHFR